jgi:primosomal protein N' (replication factor Y)
MATSRIDGKVKYFKRLLHKQDDVPILNAPILDFISWSANYYHHPIGEVLSTALPKNLRIGKDVQRAPSRVHQPLLPD